MSEMHPQAQLSSALDGTLSEAERAQVQRHLESCEQCRMEWEQLKSLDEILRAAALVSPSEDLTGQVIAHINRQEALTGWRWSLGGAVIVVALLGACAWVWPQALQLGGASALDLLDQLAIWVGTLLAVVPILLGIAGAILAQLGEGVLVIYGLSVLILTLIWTRAVSGWNPRRLA